MRKPSRLELWAKVRIKALEGEEEEGKEKEEEEEEGGMAFSEISKWIPARVRKRKAIKCFTFSASWWKEFKIWKERRKSSKIRRRIRGRGANIPMRIRPK